jgi:hypothetical protein
MNHTKIVTYCTVAAQKMEFDLSKPTNYSYHNDLFFDLKLAKFVRANEVYQVCVFPNLNWNSSLTTLTSYCGNIHTFEQTYVPFESDRHIGLFMDTRKYVSPRGTSYNLTIYGSL